MRRAGSRPSRKPSSRWSRSISRALVAAGKKCQSLALVGALRLANSDHFRSFFLIISLAVYLRMLRRHLSVVNAQAAREPGELVAVERRAFVAIHGLVDTQARRAWDSCDLLPWWRLHWRMASWIHRRTPVEALSSAATGRKSGSTNAGGNHWEKYNIFYIHEIEKFRNPISFSYFWTFSVLKRLSVN